MDSSDPNATDMRKHYAWDGSGAGPAIMTEVLEDRCYHLHLHFEIGDGSTSTTLTSQNESIIIADPVIEYNFVQSQGNLTVGEWNSTIEASKNGSMFMWTGTPTALRYIDFEGTTKIYGSIFAAQKDGTTHRWYLRFPGQGATQNIDIRDFICTGFRGFRPSNNGTMLNSALKNIKVMDTNFGLYIDNGSYTLVEGLKSETKLYTNVSGNVRIEDVLAPTAIVCNSSMTISIGNSIYNSSLANVQTDGVIDFFYDVDLNVVDQDGNSLENAILTIYDQSDNIVSHGDSITTLNEDLTEAETDADVVDASGLSTNDVIVIEGEFMEITNIVTNTLTVTRGFYTLPATNGHVQRNISSLRPVYKASSPLSDSNGDFPTQYIDYRNVLGTSEVVTTLSPHKIVVSKAGYKTKTIENITIDEQLNWRIKLERIEPAPSVWPDER